MYVLHAPLFAKHTQQMHYYFLILQIARLHFVVISGLYLTYLYAFYNKIKMATDSSKQVLEVQPLGL